MTTGTYLENVYGQPAALRAAAARYAAEPFRDALAAAAGLLRGRSVTSTGMGASFFALHAARASLDPALRPHWIDETGYLEEHFDAVERPLDVILAISQSGESVEARKLFDKLAGVPQVLITRDPQSSLARSADVVIPLECPPDLSVAVQTYITQIAVLELLARAVAGADGAPLLADLRQTADSIQALLDTMAGDIEEAAKLVSEAEQIYALGRGNSVGNALGTALLFKEAAKRDCEGQSAAQFRHGAVEVVSTTTATIVFASSAPEKTQLDENLIGELVKYGSRVVVVCDEQFPDVRDATLLRLPAAPASTRAILEIVPLQLMAHHLAERNGVTAGEFRNTVPVIVTA
jgi:glucosamine--fructose-6-phosphate aminotransferase (isomerizing)